MACARPVLSAPISTVCGMTTQSSKGAAWAGVRTAIIAGDPAVVADMVPALDEAGRRDVARELPGHISVVRKAIAERDRRRTTIR